jgi:hypothetical protein
MTGKWLVQKPAPHDCQPPTKQVEIDGTRVPDGQVGDIWQCECERYWWIKTGGNVGSLIWEQIAPFIARLNLAFSSYRKQNSGD